MGSWLFPEWSHNHRGQELRWCAWHRCPRPSPWICRWRKRPALRSCRCTWLERWISRTSAPATSHASAWYSRDTQSSESGDARLRHAVVACKCTQLAVRTCPSPRSCRLSSDSLSPYLKHWREFWRQSREGIPSTQRFMKVSQSPSINLNKPRKPFQLYGDLHIFYVKCFSSLNYTNSSRIKIFDNQTISH